DRRVAASDFFNSLLVLAESRPPHLPRRMAGECREHPMGRCQPGTNRLHCYQFLRSTAVRARMRSANRIGVTSMLLASNPPVCKKVWRLYLSNVRCVSGPANLHFLIEI